MSEEIVAEGVIHGGTSEIVREFSGESGSCRECGGDLLTRRRLHFPLKFAESNGLGTGAGRQGYGFPHR
jgi:hypothetical protein